MALPSLAQIMLKLYKTSSCNSSINHLRIKCSFLCLYFSLIVLHQLLVFQLSPFFYHLVFSPCSQQRTIRQLLFGPGGQKS